MKAGVIGEREERGHGIRAKGETSTRTNSSDGEDLSEDLGPRT